MMGFIRTLIKYFCPAWYRELVTKAYVECIDFARRRHYDHGRQFNEGQMSFFAEHVKQQDLDNGLRLSVLIRDSATKMAVACHEMKQVPNMSSMLNECGIDKADYALKAGPFKDKYQAIISREEVMKVNALLTSLLLANILDLFVRRRSNLFVFTMLVITLVDIDTPLFDIDYFFINFRQGLGTPQDFEQSISRAMISLYDIDKPSHRDVLEHVSAYIAINLGSFLVDINKLI